MLGSISKKMFRPVACLILMIWMFSIWSVCVAIPAVYYASDTKSTQTESEAKLELTSQSAILMEAGTGQIIYEKNSDKSMPPASVTKIMTLLLIFDALDEERISLDEVVTVSENAASMGGSQVFLEAGEKQTVNTMIKCISIASANDASVAMAEHICGTEAAFVAKMNERAKGLGMNNTNFVNSCGLDAKGHVTSAADIARMSRELINRYPQIHDYSTVWMDTIIHTTRKGESEFVLTNTNKLLKQYEWATGLKTGSTSKAGCCLAATASKDGIDLIAVIMSAPNSKTRFAEAVSLLNYGYSVCDIYVDEKMPLPAPVSVKGGKKENVNVEYEKTFSYMFMDKVSYGDITNRLDMMEYIEAPVNIGDVVGTLTYMYKGEEIGCVSVIAAENVEKGTYMDAIYKILHEMLS